MKIHTDKATRLMAMKDVSYATSLSASSIRRLSREKKFPQPVQITESRVAWLETDVVKWVEDVTMKGQAANDN